MLSDVALLRLYIADPAGSDNKFPTTTLQDLLDVHDGDLYATAAAVWGIRAGDVHEYYMAQIDGALMSRDQVFEHCKAMQALYEGKSGGKIVSVQMDSGFTTETATSEF